MNTTLVAVEEGLGLADDAADPNFVTFCLRDVSIFHSLGRESGACSPGCLGFGGEVSAAVAACPGILPGLPAHYMSNFVPGLPPRSFFWIVPPAVVPGAIAPARGRGAEASSLFVFAEEGAPAARLV